MRAKRPRPWDKFENLSEQSSDWVAPRSNSPLHSPRRPVREPGGTTHRGLPPHGKTVEAPYSRFANTGGRRRTLNRASREPGPPCPPRGTGFPTCLRCVPIRGKSSPGAAHRPWRRPPACVSKTLPPGGTSPSTHARRGPLNEKRRTAPYSKFSVAGARTSVSARCALIRTQPPPGPPTTSANHALKGLQT